MVTVKKLVKNRHQFKLNIPIHLVRKLNLETSQNVKHIEVKTPVGYGFVVMKDNQERKLKNGRRSRR